MFDHVSILLFSAPLMLHLLKLCKIQNHFVSYNCISTKSKFYWHIIHFYMINYSLLLLFSYGQRLSWTHSTNVLHPVLLLCIYTIETHNFDTFAHSSISVPLIFSSWQKKVGQKSPKKQQACILQNRS